jgi:hypothetical protein
VTQFTAALIYQNQSGQMNEAFSDVFGELIDLFTDVPAGGSGGHIAVQAPSSRGSRLAVRRRVP